MSFIFRLIWLCVACCSIAPTAHGQLQTIESVVPLQIHGDENGVPITPHTQLLEDPLHELELDHVRARTAGWQDGPRSALIFGFDKSVWWVRHSLFNATQQPQQLILDLGDPRQDYVDWFVLRDAGRRVEHSRSGDRYPYSERPVATRNFALGLNMAPQERVDIYMRLQSYDGLFEAMPLALYQRAAYFAMDDRQSLLIGLYHGELLALALYNLLLFIAIRERVFGAYVIYLIIFLCWSFTFRGYSFQYFWPNSPMFNNNFLTVSGGLGFAMSGWFTIIYLRLRETVPRWVLRLHVVLIVINLLVLIPAFAGYHAISVRMVHYAGLPMAMTLLATGIWLLIQGSRQARFYVVAFAVVIAGAVAYILQVSHVVPANWLTTWGVQVGSAIEVLLLALGLADAMNTLKAEKLQAERAAREAQEALNVRLEQQVSQRTDELEQANHRLHELSITDELTGAFNRRHFNSFCEAALSQHRRAALAFCMFDLDYFKSYNDRYGHQAGDVALQRIATAVQAELRRSEDVLFRLGGEEFGILFTATTPESAKHFVEQIRASVLRLAIEHHGNPTGVMTASFGVGWWGSSVVYRMTPDQLYAAADEMLYEAKESGRNQVAVAATFPTGMHKVKPLATDAHLDAQ
jgi:diguanylate cyclase (GGDEF)-like protein